MQIAENGIYMNLVLEKERRQRSPTFPAVREDRDCAGGPACLHTGRDAGQRI